MYRSTISIFLLCTLSIAVLGNHGGKHGPPPEIKAAMKECIEELGGDETMLNQFYHHEEIADPKFKCMDSCVMKKLGHVNEDGTINKEKIIEKLPPDMPNREMIVEAINTCGDEKGDDECDTAMRIRKCIMAKKPMKPPM